MKNFLSGMGMGMVAGACAGMVFSGLTTDAEKRNARKKARRAARDLSRAANDLRQKMS